MEAARDTANEVIWAVKSGSWGRPNKGPVLTLPLFEIALVLVRADDVASVIVNTAACERLLCIGEADCIIRRVILQPTEWQHIGNQINAAMIFAGADFVTLRWGRWLHRLVRPSELLVPSIFEC